MGVFSTFIILLAYSKGTDLYEDHQVESGGAMLTIVVLHQEARLGKQVY